MKFPPRAIRASYTDRTLTVFVVSVDQEDGLPLDSVFHVSEHFKALDWLRSQGCGEYYSKSILSDLDRQRSLDLCRRLADVRSPSGRPKAERWM